MILRSVVKWFVGLKRSVAFDRGAFTLHVVRCDFSTFFAAIEMDSICAAKKNVKISCIQGKALFLRMKYIIPVILQNVIGFFLRYTKRSGQSGNSRIGIIIPICTLSPAPTADCALFAVLSSFDLDQLFFIWRKENIFPFGISQLMLFSCIQRAGLDRVLSQLF